MMRSQAQSAFDKYASANQLQSSVGSYLLMFENLLRLNGEGQQAYDRGDFEFEFHVQEKVMHILTCMRNVFRLGKTAQEQNMFTYFSALLSLANRFVEFDNRNQYYVDLYELISLQYKNWKTASD